MLFCIRINVKILQGPMVWLVPRKTVYRIVKISVVLPTSSVPLPLYLVYEEVQEYRETDDFFDDNDDMITTLSASRNEATKNG